jgi:isocitrate/isopropylmalate dehydrogenase
MKNWLRKKLRKFLEVDTDLCRVDQALSTIEEQARRDRCQLKAKIDVGVEYIRSKTEVSADVHYHGPDMNQIIVVGRYRNRDYVEVFSLKDNHIEGLVDMLREWQQYATVRRVDAMPALRAFIDRDLK